jgi:hypothetical protein
VETSTAVRVPSSEDLCEVDGISSDGISSILEEGTDDQHQGTWMVQWRARYGMIVTQSMTLEFLFAV